MFNLVRESHQGFWSTQPKTGNHITSCKQLACTWNVVVYLCCVTLGMCMDTHAENQLGVCHSQSCEQTGFGLVMWETWTIFCQGERACIAVRS